MTPDSLDSKRTATCPTCESPIPSVDFFFPDATCPDQFHSVRLISAKRFRTIVADPPWRYQKNTVNGAKPGAPEAHYETMGMRGIAGLPISEIAADQAHLYLWVPVPRLYGDRGDRSFTPVDVMEAWGFEFKTMLTWVKGGSPGMGWYFRGQTEHVLFGVRGSLPIPTGARIPNVFTAARQGHSGKPDLFLDLVEQVSPSPRVELFARRARFGWDYWGDESLGTVELETA